MQPGKASAESDVASAEASSPLATATTGRRRRRRDRGAAAAAELARKSVSLTVFGLLGLSVVGSVLAAGTVHVSVLLVIAPLALAAGVFAWLRDPDAVVPAPALLLLALAGYSALQAAPLPLGVVRWLHPEGAAIWEQTFATLGVSPSLASLSLDPGASLVEALKWSCYGSVFAAAAYLGRKRDLRWCVALVFGAAVLTALVTLGHRLAGAEWLFGVYHPVYQAPGRTASPLLNPNNLAGYLNLGAFAGLSLMLAKRRPIPRWVMALGVAVLIGSSAVTGSRAGFVALAGGGVLALVLLRWRKFEGRSVPLPVLAGLGVALLAGGVFFLVGANADVWQALFEESIKKFELFSWTRPMLAKHFMTGVGRGAFESTFPAYRADAGHHLYQFAENFVMQWATEWGVPVAVAALGGLAWLLRPKQIGALSSPASLVACIAALVLVAQNLLDLGLELAGISLALFTILGGLWGRARGKLEQQPPELLSPRKAGVALAAAGLVFWLGAALVGRHSAIADRLELSEAFRQAQATTGRHQDEQLGDVALRLDAAIRRHPAEPFLPLLRGLVARSLGGNPIPWLGRAIERDPMAGRAYLVLAEVLAQRGAKAQALGALRRVAEREYGLLSRAAALAGRISASGAELELAVPDGPIGANMLTALAWLPELRARRAELLRRASERDGQFANSRYLLAEDLLAAVEKHTEPCSAAAAPACLDEAARLAEQLVRIDRDSERVTILRARVMDASGKGAEAVRFLTDSCPIFAQRISCLNWRVILARKLGDPSQLDEAATTYLNAACSDSSKCAGVADWLGGMFAAAGQHAKALQMYERAAREQGTPHAWRQVAGAAKRLGLEHAAQRALDRADRLAGKPATPVTKQLENH